MKLVINLLKQKNNYLFQFEKISALECQRLRAGDFSHIEQFYCSRQLILSAIENIDIRLKQYKAQKMSKKDQKTIVNLLRKSREITLAILQKDIFIHSRLNDLEYDRVEDQIA